MDYLESVTFVTKDQKWIEKLALGALATLLSVVVVGALALAGWAMETFRRAVGDAAEKLPGWQDWQKYLGDGLKYVGVAFIWCIAVAILSIVWRPLGYIAGVVVGFFLMGAFIILAQTGDFKRAINPVNAWNVLAPSLSQWLVTYVIIAVASALVSWLGRHTLFIITLIFTPWLTVATANLVGRSVVETNTLA